MQEGEFAVLYSDARNGAAKTPENQLCRDPNGATCTVFESLTEAENYCAAKLAEYPTLRLRIYDHEGLAKPPIRDILRQEYQPKGEMTPRVRRWLGGALLLAGIALGMLEWLSNGSLTWAGVLAVRIGPAGLILVTTELVITLENRHDRR